MAEESETASREPTKATGESFDYTLPGIMVLGLPGGQALGKYLSDEPILVGDLLLGAGICLVIFGLLELYKSWAKTWRFWRRFTLAAVAGIAVLAGYKHFFGSPVPWANVIAVGAALGLMPAILVMWARSKEKKAADSANDA